jgi:small-conductance mechanosensitive channel
MAKGTVVSKIIAELEALFKWLVVDNLGEVRRFIIESGPKIMFALAIIFLGWVFAVLIKKIISKLLRALGCDVLAEKTGLKGFLVKSGMEQNLSLMVGLIIYWIIIFTALMLAFDAVEMKQTALLIQQIFYYMPTIVMVVVVLALGKFLGSVVGRFADTAARLAQLRIHVLIGRIAQYIVIALTLMLILKHFGVKEKMLTQYAIIVFIGVPAAICFMLLLGGRDIVSNILAGRVLVKQYDIGDTIEFDSVSGEIQSIDLVTTRVKNKNAEMIVPNSLLITKIIKKT